MIAILTRLVRLFRALTTKRPRYLALDFPAIDARIATVDSDLAKDAIMEALRAAPLHCPAVDITSGGRTVRGRVIIASANGRSLMIMADHGLPTSRGVYWGPVPLLRDDNGIYRDIICNDEYELRPASEAKA